MKKITSILLSLMLSVTILMGSIPMSASAAAPKNGWVQNANKTMSYYQNGKKVTGWRTLKSYSDKKKYKYFFNNKGQLVTDLFKLNYKKWIQ